MKPFAEPLAELHHSLRYLVRWLRTPRADRAWLVRRPNPLAMVVCSIRGHRYGFRGAIELEPWRLEFCRRCGQEVMGRTSFSELHPRPNDDYDYDYDYGDWGQP